MEQIITEDGQLVSDLDKHISNIGLPSTGTSYHITSIIGPQSSGKSTIMNHIFGTRFETMNETTGRQQTTKGIHAACCEKNPILLLDVEGCDSRERGDADALFERKAALFAMALSEVLIINMWESDIGRYQASNIPLLKVVFEVNLQLFLAQQQTKTKILFLIRDFTAESFEPIMKNLYRDMCDIWKEIQIPDELEGKNIDDFFEFNYFPVHHYIIEREKFDEDMIILKKWFMESDYEDYIFKNETGKIVPGDGLSHYIRSLWDVIHNNKELNVPSQRSMLSHFKCEENAKDAYQVMVSEMEDLTETIMKNKKQKKDFKEYCQPFVNKAFETYNENSWRYIHEIVEEKKELLKQNIHDFLYPLYCKNCSFTYFEKLKEFAAFMDKYQNKFTKGGKWKEEVTNKMNEIIVYIEETSRSFVVEPFDWVFDMTRIKKELQDIVISVQDMMISVLHNSVIASNIHIFDEKANEILKEANSDMWSSLRKCLNDSISKTRQDILDILITNVPDQEPSSSIHKSFEDKAVEIVTESSKYVLFKMKSAFDAKFNYDEHGRPRVWTLNDNINLIFEEARNRGLQVLRLFSFSHLRDSTTSNLEPIEGIDKLNQVLIEHDEIEEIEEKFDQLISHVYETAEASIKAQSSQQKIPVWAWTILILLGWDKIIKLMSHPLILIILLFVGGTHALLKQIGLLDAFREKVIEKLYNTMNSLSNIDKIEKKDKEETEKAEKKEEEEEESEEILVDLTKPVVQI